MRGGLLRYRVSIQQLVAGSPQQLPTGEPDLSWVELDEVWADIRPLRGQALFTAQQINARNNVEIDLRYTGNSKTITPRMRLVHGSTVYEILSVPPLRPARGMRFIVQCSTGLTEG